MNRKFLTRFVAVVALGMATLAVAASPSKHDIYQAVEAGRIGEAEAMMREVLAEHPNSAEAHYINAEVEYRAGHLGVARTELATAQRLNPALSFADAHSVAELQQGLANNGRVRADAAVSAARPHFPWLLFLLIVGAVLLVVALFRRRQPTVVMGAPGYGPGYGPSGGPGGGPVPMGGPGYGPGYGYGPGVMNQGSGIMGSVASGLAVGAGIVAGEELARHMFEPGHPNYVDPAAGGTYVDPNADLGGNDFGVTDSGSDWGDSGGGGFSDGGGDWS